MIIGMERASITCTVTRYAVVNGRLVETTADEQTSYRINDGWLYLGNSQASVRVESAREMAREEQEWCAQSGTPPVCVDGHWGGRNYPKIHVGVVELLRVAGS